MWNAGLNEAEAGVKSARRNINNLRYTDDTTLWQKVKKNQRASWWKRRVSEKAGLKLNIQKTKIVVSRPITSWQIDGETMKTVTNFIFLDSKITADGDCSHEGKRCLLLGRKTMKNLDCILESRDITLPTKVHLVRAMVFPVVMYGCMPGASERHSTRDKGHEEGGSAYAKAGSSLGSPPGYSRASTPQNQSLPTLLLWALTSDFTGGCPPPPSHSLCQRANLQLQLIKFLGN